MDTLITTKAPTDNANLKAIFDDSNNKKTIEDYFATITTTPKIYKTTISGTEYTVTQTSVAGTTPQTYTYEITPPTP